MSARLQHAAFAVILVGTLVARERVGDAVEDSPFMQPAVIRVAQSHGLVFSGYKSMTDAEFQVLTFAAPACAGPVLVDVLPVNFDQETLVGTPPPPDYGRRYVYIDHIWGKPNRPAVIVERARQAALAVLGLTRYVPSWHLLLVDAPLGCKAADAVDWRPVWDRDYLETTQHMTVNETK
jgi:hypothetical protein